MDLNFLRTFFEINREPIYFGYGLVFFVLGLAIALQSRASSRLDLARSLSWLSAFGLLHGFYEWGDLFLPIQADYLSPGTLEVLHNLHITLLAVSFACLFQFGVALLNPLGKARWMQLLPQTVLAVWIFVSFFPLPSLMQGRGDWHDTANALARYFIGFPGGLLAAYGLRQHTYARISPLEVPHIVRTLRFGGLMLGFYAVFGGLVPPPAPFFPANVLNTATLERILIAPVPVFRSIFGLGLSIAMIRALEIFDLETNRMIEAMEQAQMLASERTRLARDLHDGAIQKVYTAGLLVQSAQKLTPADSVLAPRLEKAVNVIHDAIHDLRQNLVELHPTPIQEPLPDALRRLTDDPRFRTLVDISLQVDLPEGEDLPAARLEHIVSIVNEALSNIIRHSRARKVKIMARQHEGRLTLTIEDDGVGIPREVEAGYGLRNMRDRARLLGGLVEFDAQNGRGTLVRLDIPGKDER